MNSHSSVEIFLEKLTDLLDPNISKNKIAEIIDLINKIELPQVEKMERIYMIDSAIKLGNYDVVEALAKRFIHYKLEDDIRTPSALSEMGLLPFRPTFWLPSITTGLKHIPKEEYQKIENYLCKTFNIPDKVEIKAQLVSKKDYLAKIDLWKHYENIRLFKLGTLKTRYRRDDFLAEIEQKAKLKHAETPAPTAASAASLKKK